MANKTLRLLIAENCHAQSLLLERMLNRLGYHRIAIRRSVTARWSTGASIYPPSARSCPSQPPWHVCPARWMRPALAPS
ncbi:hypothetical protein CLJ1_2914 [Pseudomonas paraeruginosa]|nr:hypothetical protein CLJ1_2914 [Pseudomonas aeruginosa]